MNTKHIALISTELGISARQAENTMNLLSEGSTVPFISRYRKEVTGSLDEVQIGRIEDLQKRYKEVDERREFIIKTITEQEKMTPELQEKLEGTWVLAELEDIYLPYKPKRKTRATAAIEKGLEPLAKILLEQQDAAPATTAQQFINEQVASGDEALKGARDIIAEWINENAELRDKLRKLFTHTAVLTSKVIEGKETEGDKYKDYFEFQEELKAIPSHRVLAIFRGESEGFLYATITPVEEEALSIINKQFVTGNNASSEQVTKAATDAYKRLLRPSLENEFRAVAKEAADGEAIDVFAENLRQLLLAAPLGPKPVIAVDPGYRTGCKVVALDEQGNMQANDVIYPLEKNYKRDDAEQLLKQWVKQYDISAIAVGNGTAGRETEEFLKKIDFGKKINVFMVNESGASVYSASEVAREEFPDHDVTVRGAVSIGRRLIDPLAELVKIDPKSIGVGQYQHDVNQSSLKQSLDRIVVSCVNMVGVNLNTASKHLLAYISGLGPSLAENIVKYRKENGAFSNRSQLKKVPRLGEKAFEQCAGFLRIEHGDNPLDNSAVHPERYNVVEEMASKQQCSVQELLSQDELRKKINLKDYVKEDVGLLTLEDILKELDKPSRDPRDEISIFEYAEGIHKIEDVKPGMVLPGVVTNITNFGAFVDIGVKQDGLVHISHLSNKFVSNPNEAVKLNQKVQVTVLEVDAARKRISLSMKDSEAPAQRREPRRDNRDKPAKGGAQPLNDFQAKLQELKKKFN
ncbi:RNA-binding transcriptional accessory protein [Chitinophaga pendula]|uniref:Tex family protein n=1 Tax=Chitinophaga TaxID=79328 RepID=UPI000BB05B9B|nr:MULTISPECIES: Tex family protein [Chitinophaga]ASZ14047.1 RNA-binding transcriptional accessory protein [Chitinophaga sp. MD30]UCJ08322.1 RNA-binding transcriptional accessory protein [Chitinophaga pendula]